MAAMTSLDASTTTGAQAGASRTTYCPDVAALDDPDVVLFDFMDHAYVRAVQTLPVLGAVTWRKGASIAALSTDYYGTTTHWQTILLFNGYIASSKIPPGATVNLPDVSGLKAKLQVSNKGKVVRI